MKRYQRGISLIGAAIAGVALLAVLGIATAAWHHFTGGYVDEGKQIQLEADQKVKDADELRVKAAEGGLGNCKAALETQAGQITAAQAEAGKAQAATAAMAKAARDALAGNAAAQASLRAMAAAAPQAQACEIELKQADDIGRPGALKRRGATP